MTLSSFSLPESCLARRITLLDCPMDALSMEESIGLIEQAIASRQSLQHVVVNTAKLVNMQKDAALYEDVVGSDLINIDGMGVVWGARFMGLEVPERVAGVDIMENLLARCAEKGYRPYILGAKPEILDKAVANIMAKYPDLEFAGTSHGYYDRDKEAELMASIRDAEPDCLFIAISSPHKERVMADYKDMLEIPFIMGVGGSVDVIAGYVNRAPEWMQRAGLEWFYRLCQEPRRMWKRYLVTNARFAWLLVRGKMGRRGARMLPVCSE